MVLDTSLLNTQEYKICIKGKVEQFIGVVAIEKEAFWSPSTKVANFTYQCIPPLEIEPATIESRSKTVQLRHSPQRTEVAPN